MNKGENHEQPHQQMMNIAGRLLATENQYAILFPDWYFRKEQVKTADQLKYCGNDDENVGHPSQHVVTEPICVVTALDVAVPQYGVEEIFDISRRYRQVLKNSLLLVAKKIQKNPRQHRRGKDVTGDEMDKPRPGHDKRSTSFRQGVGPRAVNIKAGDAQGNN